MSTQSRVPSLTVVLSAPNTPPYKLDHRTRNSEGEVVGGGREEGGEEGEEGQCPTKNDVSTESSVEEDVVYTEWRAHDEDEEGYEEDCGESIRRL